MRPRASTAVASVKIRPAPPIANCPRWTTCQSVATPSSAEYWHIGEMTTRFFSTSSLSLSGENNIVLGPGSVIGSLRGFARHVEQGATNDHVLHLIRAVQVLRHLSIG